MTDLELLIKIGNSTFEDRKEHKTSNQSQEIIGLIESRLDFYTLYMCHADGLKDVISYYTLYDRFWRYIDERVSLYNPTWTKELIQTGMVEINVVVKDKVKEGKRTQIKSGRFLTQLSQLLNNKLKENIAATLKDNYLDVSHLTFNKNDTDFVKVVTKRLAKSTEFMTTYRHKNLWNSCMRYKAFEMGLDIHPYRAYASGDFEIAWLEHEDKLYARAIIHKESKTYSAIYGVNKSSCVHLEEILNNQGYSPVSDSGEEWLFAKLLHIVTDYEGEYGCMTVILAPYIDFWDFEYGYSDGTYIHMTREEPKGISRYSISLQSGDGWVEY